MKAILGAGRALERLMRVAGPAVKVVAIVVVVAEIASAKTPKEAAVRVADLGVGVLAGPAYDVFKELMYRPKGGKDVSLEGTLLYSMLNQQKLKEQEADEASQAQQLRLGRFMYGENYQLPSGGVR